MRSFKTVFYVGITVSVVSLNVLAYRLLQEHRLTTGLLAVISTQQTMSTFELTLARVQALQARGADATQ